jgi:hypothetical protein
MSGRRWIDARRMGGSEAPSKRLVELVAWLLCALEVGDICVIWHARDAVVVDALVDGV